MKSLKQIINRYIRSAAIVMALVILVVIAFAEILIEQGRVEDTAAGTFVRLEQIIEELDIAMRKQFQEQFQLIAKEFDTVFKELFGGGKGTLELMEDEDILEAGIRIIAQPPGKKLQNMMQLSGGEKALTAIALLFAIQNLKPSPFCLLDEIERRWMTTM